MKNPNEVMTQEEIQAYVQSLVSGQMRHAGDSANADAQEMLLEAIAGERHCRQQSQALLAEADRQAGQQQACIGLLVRLEASRRAAIKAAAAAEEAKIKEAAAT